MLPMGRLAGWHAILVLHYVAWLVARFSRLSSPPISLRTANHFVVVITFLKEWVVNPHCCCGLFAAVRVVAVLPYSVAYYFPS